MLVIIFYLRPFYIGKIPNSNLLLVAVDHNGTEDTYPKSVTDPQDIVYDNVKNPCHKLILNDLERRPLSGCYNEHPLENTINECGCTVVPNRSSHYCSYIILVILNLLVIINV